jgi:Fe-S cluster assembly iron-binding protein IscA
MEFYFQRLIDECRAAFDRSRTGVLYYLGLKRRCKGNEDGVAGLLEPTYRVLAEEGQVVWGAIAQANRGLFDPDDEDDLPGITVYSPDEHYDAHPKDLREIGRACYLLKDTLPKDEKLQKVADRLTDEYDLSPRQRVPKKLTDGREVYLAATMFHRKRLPGAHLQASVFPVVIAPDDTELNMVLPLAYWSATLCQDWHWFDKRLGKCPTTSTARAVAEAAEKGPRDPTEVTWDIDAMPILVTKAMVEALSEMAAEEIGPNALPMVLVELTPAGKGAATLVSNYDSETEILVLSNEVGVVMKKDQVEQLKGAILDFKNTIFGKGVSLRMRDGERNE